MIPTHPHIAYYDRLRKLDRKGAIALVEELVAEGRDVESIYADVLMPALAHTGQEWEEARISVAHEHYITEVTREVIRRLGPRMWVDSNGSGRVAVACCAPGERHAVGLMMVGDVLRSRGLAVHILGEGAPAADVQGFVEEVKANLLCVSCALTIHLPETFDLIHGLRAVLPRMTILAGGGAFRDHPERAIAMGADYYAADVRELQHILPRILEAIPAVAH